jgi:hypothetical protein
MKFASLYHVQGQDGGIGTLCRRLVVKAQPGHGSQPSTGTWIPFLAKLPAEKFRKSFNRLTDRTHYPLFCGDPVVMVGKTRKDKIPDRGWCHSQRMEEAFWTPQAGGVKVNFYLKRSTY